LCSYDDKGKALYNDSDVLGCLVLAQDDFLLTIYE